MDISHILQTLAVYALPVLFAVTVHEAAHGYVARRLGDDTAFLMGRLTLNPLKHVDPIGTVLIPLVLLLMPGSFMFGYAKPVPVNFSNLRNPRLDMVWVALAGPVSNFLQAVVWALIFGSLREAGVQEPFFARMAMAGIQVNLMLAAFNLLPIPPLDGGRVLVGLLPWGPSQWVARIEPYGFFIVLGLIYMGLGNYWTRPLMSAGMYALSLLAPSLGMLR